MWKSWIEFWLKFKKRIKQNLFLELETVHEWVVSLYFEVCESPRGIIYPWKNSWGGILSKPSHSHDPTLFIHFKQLCLSLIVYTSHIMRNYLKYWENILFSWTQKPLSVVCIECYLHCKNKRYFSNKYIYKTSLCSMYRVLSTLQKKNAISPTNISLPFKEKNTVRYVAGPLCGKIIAALFIMNVVSFNKHVLRSYIYIAASFRYSKL